MAAVPVGHGHGATGLPASPQSAASELYEVYADRILRFCRSRLRSREEAEDALQLTYLYALRALRRGVVPECEIAWLLKIAENVCLSTRRAAGRRSVEELREPHLLAEQVSAHGGDADRLFSLPEALATLTEGQRRALLLREWRGLSYREIADELGISQAAVETALFRARGALAEALEGRVEAAPRKRARVFDLGALLAGGKGALAGGAGTKVAAGLVAAAVLVPVASAPRQPVPQRTSVEIVERTMAPVRTEQRLVRADVPATPLEGEIDPPAAPARAPVRPTEPAAPSAIFPRVRHAVSRPPAAEPRAPTVHPSGRPTASEPEPAPTHEAVEITPQPIVETVEATADPVLETVEATAEPVVETAETTAQPALQTVVGGVESAGRTVAGVADGVGAGAVTPASVDAVLPGL